MKFQFSNLNIEGRDCMAGTVEQVAANVQPGSKEIADCVFPVIPESAGMKVEKVKYVLWASDWKRCLDFYKSLFGGVISFEMEVWSEIVIAGATIGVHGGGEGKRTWTGLSFQVDDLREGIVKLKECGGDLTCEPTDTVEDPLHLAMCIDTEGNEFMMTMKRG